jgi:O-antigen/teichoic acid export membrane protein
MNSHTARRPKFARNTALNLLGQGLPLIVGVLTTPRIVHGLGPERYGVLATALVVLGYFGLFDLGLGRAATRFVASALGGGRDDEVPAIAWTAVMVQAGLGLLGTVILIAVTPLLVEHLLNIPPSLRDEARSSFQVLAFSIPAVLVSGSLRGVLEASQRFDLLNAAAAPLSAANFLLPYIGVILGWRLPGILGVLLASRLLGAVTFYLLSARVFPSLMRAPRLRVAHAKLLLGFGAWVTISSLVGPALVYVDRLALGVLATMTAVAYYSAPYEMVTRLLIVPISLVGTLFPAFSGMHAQGNGATLEVLVARSIKYLLLALGPLIAVILAFSDEILRLWLGPDFASHSALALRILSLGVLANGIAQVPFALIQGWGRPDITAKIHLAEVPIQIVVAWVLVSRWGITGAALAWTGRTTLDLLLLSVLARKVTSVSTRSFVKDKVPQVLYCLAILSLVAAGSSQAVSSSMVRVLVLFVTLMLWAVVTWFRLLSDGDRAQIGKVLSQAVAK